MLAVKANCGLRLSATQDFKDEKGKLVPAGHRWQVEGPMTYIPRADVVSSFNKVE